MMANRPVVRLNVLARDLENARRIVESTNGSVYIGLMVKNFASVEAAVAKVEEYQQAGVPVSVGLGAGDPAQWLKVVQVAEQTRPAHVNQVFPAAGYTLAALRGAGAKNTIVNALIAPGGTAGKVCILTGPQSQQCKETISCGAAAALLSEIGVPSVKFYPIDGAERLDEVAAMVKAAVACGIKIFEPTGGIDVNCVSQIVEVCAVNGAEVIVPHLYTSLVDQESGLTDAALVARLTRELSGI